MTGVVVMNRRTLLGVVLLIAFGCSHFVPNVPVTAPAGYTPAQVEADEKACARARTDDASYATCMIARGYSTYFSVGSAMAGEDYANVLVASTRPREPDAIGADLRECKTSATDKEASGLTARGGSW